MGYEDEVQRKERRRKLRKVLAVFLVAVLAVSTIGAVRTIWGSKREDQTFTKLAERVGETAAAPVQKEETDVQEAAEEDMVLAQYRALREENRDFIGWLKVEGTRIDYPVMYTPEEPQFYIRRDFYGKESVSGTPFLGVGCDADSMSAIIYGHNMKNGTMFGTLAEYQDRAYWEAHPLLSFDTTKERREYEIFCAFYTRLLYDNEEGFRYYEYVGELEKPVFDELIDELSGVACYDTGIVPEYGDRLLFLSTCSYHTDYGRFVIVARQKNGAGSASVQN